MKKKVITSLVAAGLVAVVGMGSTLAYLQDMTTTPTTNIFTIGDVKIDLDEPEWKPTKAEDMIPGAIVEKNPIVTNVGQTESLIAVRLDGLEEVVSQGFVIKSNKNDAVLDAEFGTEGKVTDASQLFAWNPAYTLVDKAGTPVTQGSDDVLTAGELKALDGDTLYFAYESPVAAGAQTASLFDTVKLDTDVLGATSEYTIVKHFIDGSGNILKENNGVLNGTPAKNEDGTYKYKFTVAGQEGVHETYAAAKAAVDALEAEDTTGAYEFNLDVWAAAIQSTNATDSNWADTTHWFKELPGKFLGNE